MTGLPEAMPTPPAVSEPGGLEPVAVERGLAHLRAVDPALGRAIDAVGPFRLTLERNLFFALVDAIMSQQLSVKAAATILERVRRLSAPEPFPTPARLLATPDEELRRAGCSRAKALYLKDLSARIVDGSLDLDRLRAMPDEEVVAALVAVKGIGRWTAEMFLIFSLGRLDVWPVDDLGIVIAVQDLYTLPARPKPKELRALGERWGPYRTMASWYLWQTRRIAMGLKAEG